MSDINTQLNTINTALNNIKEAIIDKGQTPSGNITTYAEAISNIETGITPTGSIDITQNGTYDVTEKAQAVVNVSVQPEPFPVRLPGADIDENGYVKQSSSLVEALSGSSSPYVLGNLYWYYNEKPFYVDASGIKGFGCVKDESVKLFFPNLSTAFRESSVKYIDFSNLSKLPIIRPTSGFVPLSSFILRTVGVHIYFRALTSSNITESINAGNDDFFSTILTSAEDVTIHFPMNLESYIRQYRGYPWFGGTETTILYDLPATS